MAHYEKHRSGFMISTHPQKLQLDVLHAYLTDCYWSKGIKREKVERSIRHSLNFGVYHADGRQIGFARVVSDQAIFAYLCDVFILEEFRGQGLSKWLMECVLAHPDLQNLKRWILATRDAHGLYEKFGFEPLDEPKRYMQISRPGAVSLE